MEKNKIRNKKKVNKKIGSGKKIDALKTFFGFTKKSPSKKSPSKKSLSMFGFTSRKKDSTMVLPLGTLLSSKNNSQRTSSKKTLPHVTADLVISNLSPSKKQRIEAGIKKLENIKQESLKKIEKYKKAISDERKEYRKKILDKDQKIKIEYLKQFKKIESIYNESILQAELNILESEINIEELQNKLL